jgi:hypothetical protein
MLDATDATCLKGKTTKVLLTLRRFFQNRFRHGDFFAYRKTHWRPPGLKVEMQKRITLSFISAQLEKNFSEKTKKKAGEHWTTFHTIIPLRHLNEMKLSDRVDV